MRIIRFPRIIINEESREHSLRNCSVVIDGSNYLHHMYEKSKIPFIYGCETDKYAEYLKEEFKMFEKANVKCFVVFKGGDTDIEKKIKKFKHLVFDFDINSVFIPPLLLNDAHKQVVDEMGVNYAYCVTQSKDDCVAIARKLECPIISFDVEYCFRRAPYIPSVTLEFNPRSNSIQCRQYKLQDFLQKNSLTEEDTAIFATLTDTTIFPEKFFDTLFLTWRVWHRMPAILLKNLIRWLSNHSNQVKWDGISKTLNDDDLKKFRLNYHNILTNMRKEEVGLVAKYLLDANLAIAKVDPEWFEKGVVNRHVSQKYINLYKHKVIEGSWVTLDTESEDSLLLSIDIIKYAYNLLTNYKRDTIKVYQDANHYVEIDTGDTNVQKPKYICNVSVFENGWDEVKDLKLFEHFLTENDINIQVLLDAELPADFVVLLIALVYFARKKHMKGDDVTREVYAVILSYVVLNLPSNYDAKDGFKVKLITKKYYHYDEEEAKYIFDGEALKRFVELQSCILHMNYLNTLCGSPFESSQYSKFYNGTFIFKVFCDMKDKDGDRFVKELFQSVPLVISVFEDLIKVYRQLLITK